MIDNYVCGNARNLLSQVQKVFLSPVFLLSVVLYTETLFYYIAACFTATAALLPLTVAY